MPTLTSTLDLSKPRLFLTLEDPRARVKGSRDPLGVVPLWSAFGRHVVTNLTTVTRSVRGFTVLLIGRHLAGELLDAGKISEGEDLGVFLRCEQLGAYARHIVHGSEGILGITRVSRRAQSEGGKIRIQSDAGGKILSDQKTYGLWGLYTVAARVSGLLDDSGRPTHAALEHLGQEILPNLEPRKRSIESILTKGGWVHARSNDQILSAFGSCLGALGGEEVAFYSTYIRDGNLVRGAESPGRQARFRELLEKHVDLTEPVGRQELLLLADKAARVDQGLAARLRAILDLEALLAPCDVLFGHLQARQGRKPAEVARTLLDRWGRSVPNLRPRAFESLLPEVSGHVSAELASVMTSAATALVGADYEQLIHFLLDWNRLVMAERNAAPWVQLDEAGRLDVRYRGLETELPGGDELPDLWRNPYFIDSLAEITRQLAEAAQ